MLVAQDRIPLPLAFAAVLVGLLPANSAAVFIAAWGYPGSAMADGSAGSSARAR